jgi:hypothetical protein
MPVVCVLLLFLLLEAARRQRKEALILEYQYRLFALRDNLRERALQNPRVAKGWVFQYLDSTIAKSIRVLPGISIWYLLALVLTYGDDESLGRLRGSLDKEYEKSDTKPLKEVEGILCQILAEFILSRHVLMFIMSFVAVALPAALAATVRRMKRKSLELVLESPETSTLQQFAPSH